MKERVNETGPTIYDWFKKNRPTILGLSLVGVVCTTIATPERCQETLEIAADWKGDLNKREHQQTVHLDPSLKQAQQPNPTPIPPSNENTIQKDALKDYFEIVEKKGVEMSVNERRCLEIYKEIKALEVLELPEAKLSVEREKLKTCMNELINE